jgi:hypothetical protein
MSNQRTDSITAAELLALGDNPFLLGLCLGITDSELDPDYLIFDIDGSDYTQFNALVRMVNKDPNIDLDKYIDPARQDKNEALINFLCAQNYSYFRDFKVPFVFMFGVVETHKLANGWSVVSDYDFNDKKGITGSQIVSQEAWEGTLAQQAWLNMFLKAHKKAPESGFFATTLTANAD